MSTFYTVGENRKVMKIFWKAKVGLSDGKPFNPTIHFIGLPPKETFTHVHRDI